MSLFRPRWAAVLLLLICSTASRAQDAAPVVQILDNGATLICRQERDTPLVAVDAFVRVGAAQEKPSEPGVGSFVARTVLASTSARDRETMAHQIGALGNNISATWTPDYTQISALALVDKFDDTARIVTDALTNATFDPVAVNDARKATLTEINNAEADVFQTAYTGLQRRLYGDSGYALPPLGTRGSIAQITRDDLLSYYSRYYVPKNIVLVVVGNVDPAVALKALSQGLDAFHDPGRIATGRALPDPPLPTPDADFPTIRQTLPELSEMCLMVGYRVPPISSTDYPALLVANALLGGMKSSLLFTNLRDKQGLSYDLGSVLTSHLTSGDFAAYAFAAPTHLDPVTQKQAPIAGLLKQQILDQCQALSSEPPTAAALARAQHFLIGSYNIRHERIEDRATLLGVAAITRPEGYQFDTDYAKQIGAVTAADVQRVATKYFAHSAVSIVEPANADTDSIHL